MSEETKTEDMRYELGREAKQRGEQLHDGASEEYRRGYASRVASFGSNITPSRFGAGASKRSDWTCVCSTQNRSYRNQCDNCGVRRSVALSATEGA